MSRTAQIGDMEMAPPTTKIIDITKNTTLQEYAISERV
jgi:hypothetical protein